MALGQRLDRAVQHVLFGGRVVDRRQVLVNPAVDADLVASALQDRRDHVGVEQVADRGDEERRRQLVLVEQPQDARHAVDRAVLAARDRFRDQVAGGEIRGRVVDVEAQADRDARAVGPRRRLQPLAGADVEHLRLELRQRQLRPRLRPRLRRASVGRRPAPSSEPICNLKSAICILVMRRALRGCATGNRSRRRRAGRR